MDAPEEFARFARRATAGIDDHRERRDAAEEIVAHLLDGYADALAAGATDQEARASVLARMGAASAVEGPMGRAHTRRWSAGIVVAAIGAALGVFGVIWLVFWLAMAALTPG